MDDPEPGAGDKIQLPPPAATFMQPDPTEKPQDEAQILQQYEMDISSLLEKIK